MTSATPQVTCFCDSDIVTTAYAVAGLIELADAGEIQLQFRSRDPAVPRPLGHWVLWLKVDEGSDVYGLAIDCHDRTDYFCTDSLAACRYYFKSNLSATTFDRVPTEQRSRLRPLGPYFPCRARRDRSTTYRWLCGTANYFRQRLLQSQHRLSLFETLREFRRDVQRRDRYRSRMPWPAYEIAPAETFNRDSPIVFNPTCWSETEGEEIRRLNQQRAELIVALRQAFGPRFVGGFRRVGPAYQSYPDAVESRTLSHAEHLELLKQSRLAVYTNGKWGCFSWRLAETLATAKCIVSEPIPNDAGTPLDQRVGITQCQSVDEIVTTLDRLSKSPDEVLEQSHRAYAYYVGRVRPDVRMRALLAEAAANTPSAQNN
jgi:hypothetical protein